MEGTHNESFCLPSDSFISIHFCFCKIRRKSNRSYVAIKMFEKCIQISGSFVPAYLGLSKIQSGISTGVLLRKALRLNEESPIVRLEFADWLYANSKYFNFTNRGWKVFSERFDAEISWKLFLCGKINDDVSKFTEKTIEIESQKQSQAHSCVTFISLALCDWVRKWKIWNSCWKSWRLIQKCWNFAWIDPH